MSSSVIPIKVKEPAYLKVEIGENEIKLLEKIFEIMEKDQLAFEFLEPVDYIGLNILDYPKIIKHPMDLGTVKKNLLEHKYTNFMELLDDVNLIWSNCRTYNLPGSDIVRMANHCEKLFNKNLDKTFKNYHKMKKVNKNDNEKLTANEKVRFAEIIRQQTNETLQKIVKLLLKEAPKAIDDSDSEKFQIRLDSIEYKIHDMVINLIENCNNNDKESYFPLKNK